jgi:hypothetical protein
MFGGGFNGASCARYSMSMRVNVLVGCGLLALAPLCYAQYTMDLTSAGNGTVADGVYVSPYAGKITGPGMSYSGFMICDDFNTESYLNTPWTATMSNAGALNGIQKFGAAAGSSIMFDGTAYSIQQAYDAAGWLANGLLLNLNNAATQTNYAFAIWNLFDGQSTDPRGGAQALEAAALAAASGGYVASNVSVFTPNPTNSSQEFLVVQQAPEIDPATAASAITLLLGSVLVLRAQRTQGSRS